MRMHKPDLMTVLVVLVVGGLLMTMFATSSSSDELPQMTAENIYQHGWSKVRP